MTAAGDNLDRNPRSLDDIEATGAAWLTEAELAALVGIARAAQAVAKMCWRCQSTASPETRSERHGHEWCNVCWDHVQPGPAILAAALARLNTQEGT